MTYPQPHHVVPDLIRNLYKCHSCLDQESIQIIMKTFYVYIMASQKYGTLYIGVTNDLTKRIYQHKQNMVKGFTQKYHVHNLVYLEEYSDVNEAISREKNLKKWKRSWKIKLIETKNPEWKDLYSEIIV